MNADRIVLPIPPGVRWCDEMPVIVRPGATDDATPKLEGPRTRQAKPKPVVAKPRDISIASGGIRFGAIAPVDPVKLEKKPRAKKPKAKNDPKLAAAARELRDRWLEQVNNGGEMLIESAGKYDVARILPTTAPPARLALPEAA
jgi:hypothetical protein